MRQRLESWADYFGGVGLALVVVSGIFYLLKQPSERSLVLAALGVVFIALYVYARPQQVRQAAASRGVMFGSNALLVIVAFIGLVAMLDWLSVRYSQRYDTTANKSQSLSDLTVKALKDLKEPVKATAFYVTLRPDAQTLQDAQDKLKAFARESDKFTYQFVDPQADPQIANDYKVQFDATIVFQRGTRRENVFNTDEQTLTNALLKVTQDKQQVIYFVTGHGEHGIDDSGDNGISGLKTQLDTFNLQSNSINLRAISSTLPSDLSAMVIAGPRQKFDTDEIQRVKDYLEKSNGRVFLLADPQTDTGLDALLKSWGLNFRNDAVIDPSSSITGRPQILVVSAFKSHETTKEMTGFSLVLPGVRSMFADSPSPAGRTTSPLFASSANSWGETNFDSLKNGNPQFDANADTKGPLDIAYAAEMVGDKPARLVVLGNSSFVTNSTLRSVQGTANGLFFVDALNWLAGQENLIAIPPKPTSSNPLLLSAESANFVFLSSFLFLPGAMILIGAIIWWRRR